MKVKRNQRLVRALTGIAILGCVWVGSGCSAGRVGGGRFGWVDRGEPIDVVLAARARQERRRQDPDFPEFDERRVEWDGSQDWDRADGDERPGLGSVIVGELIAIFPGAIVPGLGHYYAGDYRTSGQLRRIGGFGILLTSVGGGLATGGYFLDQEDDVPSGYAYGLYGTGGTIGLLGLAYYLTAYIYDIADTPRAIRSGGRPPPRSPFVEGLDIFSQ